MKITSVECYLGQFITMKINTDEGIYGWGEAGLAYGNSFEAAFGQCQDCLLYTSPSPRDS